MAKINVEANQCDVCGHVWLPSGKPAVQCAKCRSRRWDRMPDSSLGDRLMEVSAMSGALGIKRTPYPGAPEGTVAATPKKETDEFRAEYWRPVALPSKMERTVEYEE